MTFGELSGQTGLKARPSVETSCRRTLVIAYAAVAQPLFTLHTRVNKKLHKQSTWVLFLSQVNTKKIVPSLMTYKWNFLLHNNAIVALHVSSNPHCAAKITRSLRSLVLLYSGTIRVALDV